MNRLQRPENGEMFDVAEWDEAIRAYEAWPTREYDPYLWSHVEKNNQIWRHNSFYGYRLPGTTFAINTDSTWLEQPSWSVFVPVDLYREPLENIISTIAAIDEACQNGAGVAEVTLCSNSSLPFTYNSNEDSVDWGLSIRALGAAIHAYNSFTNDCKVSLGSVPAERVRLRAYHQFISPSEGLNEIRHSGTLSLIREFLARQLPIDQPIVYLDADTTYVEPEAITDMLEVLRENKAHFAHARLEFIPGDYSRRNLESAMRTGLSETQLIMRRKMPTDADGVDEVYCLARFLLESNLGPTDPRPYHEEVGTAFTARTWMHVGGVSTLDPEQGQNRTLLERTVKAFGTDVPPIYYVDGRIGTSSRRFRRLAGSLKAYELPMSEYGDGYDNSRMIDASIRNGRRRDRVTTGEVQRMIDIMEQRQIDLTGSREKGYTPKQREELARKIASYAFVLAA